jgi:hypothetical protein
MPPMEGMWVIVTADTCENSCDPEDRMERQLIPREGFGLRKLEIGRLFVAPTISDISRTAP